MQKRGLSEIIATVLIILLAIAAVVIVWSFISGGIKKTAGTIDIQNELFNAGYEIAGGTYVRVSPTMARVSVVKKSGGSENIPIFPVVVVKDSNGAVASKESRDLSSLGEFESASIDITLPTGFGAIEEISVFAAALDREGNIVISTNPIDTFAPEIICNNNLDDDRDGNADCADRDCDGRTCGLNLICRYATTSCVSPPG